jgi:acyl-coenzyme A thioesterase PaaI-like protein
MPRTSKEPLLSVPDLETWRARWSSPDHQRLGVRAESVADGYASFVVNLPYGDERDDDPLMATAALTFASDVAALSAVQAHLDDEREQSNGTASLHLNYVAPPSGTVTIEARIVSWGALDSLVEVTGRDSAGQLVIQGLVSYSMRPKTTAAPA